MNKTIVSILLCGLFFSNYGYNGSTLAPVVIAGGVIKAKHLDEPTKKYKRKDCPVCKGKGWYVSGDGISKVDCGYCEPEIKQIAPDNGCKTHSIKR